MSLVLSALLLVSTAIAEYVDITPDQIESERKRGHTVIVLTEHFTPKAGCPTSTSGINPLDPQYADCCNEATTEKFVAIQEPMDVCITQDAYTYYQWEDFNSTNYARCVYDGPDITGGDSNCATQSVKQCQGSPVPLNVCALVYATIIGEQQNASDPGATAVWTKLRLVSAPPAYTSSKPTMFRRKEFNTTDCSGNYLILDLVSDDCLAAQTRGVAKDAGIYVLYNNQYDPLTKNAKYCLYHSATCGVFDNPAMHSVAQKHHFLCREYEVGKCETDGVRSQYVEVLDPPAICDATVQNCMPTDGASALVAASTALVASAYALLA